MMHFSQKLENAWRSTGSMLCVGLDPRMEAIPGGLRAGPRPFLEFNRRVIDATLGHACAYKPQFACYAAEGRLDELWATLEYLRENAPDRVTILDAKRGDICSTAEQYAREAFEVYGADAVTVNPYMGGDTLVPFTRHAERGVVVLCKTSNPGSRDLQNLMLAQGHPLFEEVARKAAGEWNDNGNLALVVGATYPREMARVRALAGEMPLLVPGIGAQGGDLEATLRAGLRADGWGLLINSARGIIHASDGDDFAEAAGRAARQLSEACRQLREAILTEGRS
jgi:orotidine-5'-phosphate decarboxylase